MSLVGYSSWDPKESDMTEHTCIWFARASLVASPVVKNSHVMLEIWFQSLSQQDPLKKKMATHSSFLAWEIPWTEELGRSCKGVGHDLGTKPHQQ